MKGMMAPEVFISYAAADKMVADAVCWRLESIHHVPCWIAPRDVPPGKSSSKSSLDALDRAKVMVLVFSGDENASPQIAREVARAVHRGISVIPLDRKSVV